jgi:hypothetical protein
LLPKSLKLVLNAEKLQRFAPLKPLRLRLTNGENPCQVLEASNFFTLDAIKVSTDLSPYSIGENHD